MRDAVDALVASLDAPEQASGKEAPVLSAAACARLCSVRTVTLRSMRSICAMLLQPGAGAFPRLQSLRLLLEVGGMKPGGNQTVAITPCAPCSLAWTACTHVLDA
jgi:hypothetical protein